MSQSNKQVIQINTRGARHWVGDGFPVSSLFSWHSHGQQISPFLLLDYAGPHQFEATTQPRGVGDHPHRGFETVTLVYQGEVTHRDSAGGGGTIGPGDVQWMTAGAGVIHQEYHSQPFTKSGGELEMLQLWVNLPAASKMAEPAYQTLGHADIPRIALPDQAGELRLIAGEYQGVRGPAQTFTAVNLWDISLNPAATARLEVAEDHNTMIVVRRGEIEIGGQSAVAGQWILLSQTGHLLNLSSSPGAEVVLFSGQPIDEPIAAYGPFVMNTHEQIQQAMQDYSAGRFGRIPPVEQNAA